MGILYQKAKSSISEHIKEIFKDGELNEDSVVRKYRTTAADGKVYNTSYYNLDVIISVGYRVKSHQGTQFRIWATQRIKEYIIKGFTIDDERLKSGNQPNYFQELLDRIRDIRSSEKVFYQRVKDIYTTSIDYDPGAKTTETFLLSTKQITLGNP
ncbi:RhuM family protein [Paraflavitalea speifideaquila]|uniref:RhuM family protein n=1 Tax=Paraflavitalea speifideaquila TaxID=3076558 RepID=UPI0028EF5D6A|nr:RhuM family protein [Paraflavitalea speifideiaquila]